MATRPRVAALPAFLLAWLQCVPPTIFSLAWSATAFAEASPLLFAADTYLRKGSPNHNQGAEPILRLRNSGDNRTLLRIDHAALLQRVGSGEVVSATLELTIVRNGNNWGSAGRTIDLHRLTKAWTELGATWNCAIDANPSNAKADCAGATAWQMTLGPDNPWVTAPTATTRIRNGQTGTVRLDLTADVRAFVAGTQPNVGWVLRKTQEDQNGLVEFASRETATPPRLLLEVQAADAQAPSLAITAPADGAILSTPTPAITLAYSDGGSGVDLLTLDVQLDGNSLACTAGPASADCAAPSLADGPHGLAASLNDHAGNSATAQCAFTVQVGPPVTLESGFIHGTVLHALTEAPLADAVISVEGASGAVRTGADGRFQFPTPAAGHFVVEIGKAGFTSVQRPIDVLQGRDVAVAPAYLTPHDGQVTLITQAQGGVATDSTGTFEVTFPPGAAPRDLSVIITPLDQERQLPGPMQDGQGHLLAVNFEPRFTTFNAPASLRVRNTMGVPPGTVVNLQLWHEDDQRWQPEQAGQVTADGQWIEFQIIRFFCWYCIWLNRVLPPGAQNPQQPTPTTAAAQDPSNGCDVRDQSSVCLSSGRLSESHSLPGIRTLGANRTLTLTYHSSTASPSVLLGTDYVLAPPTLVPSTTSATIQIEGRLIAATFDGAPGALRQAALWDGRNARGQLVPTGAYPYTVALSNDYDATFGGTGVPAMDRAALTSEVASRAVLVNERASPFGAGWSLEGLERLAPQPDGTLLVTDGDGSAIVFRRGPHRDLATVSSSVDDVLVLSGHGDGTFQPPQRFVLTPIPPSSSHAPSSIASGDFNEDGRSDLAVALSQTGEVALLFGLGRTAFAAPQRVAVEPAAVVVNAADFNQDGFEDLAVVGQASQVVAVLLGRGDGTFEPKRLAATGSVPVAMAVGDLTGEGIADLAVTNAGSQDVTVLVGAGDGTFQPAPSLPSGQTPTAVAIGDFNADAKADLLISNRSSGALSLLRGHGDGTFDAPQSIPVAGHTPGALAAGDYNRDGRLDVAVADFDLDTIAVLLNAGAGAFQRAPDLPSGNGPIALAAGDATQDGVDDLAATNSIAGSVSFFAGAGDGTFAPHREVPVGFQTVGLVLGEFDDRRGDPDQVFSGLPGEFSQVRKHPDGTSTRQLTDGTQLAFDARGFHASTTDRNGNATRFLYDAQDRLARVEFPGGAAFDLGYGSANGLLSAVTDTTGRTTQMLVDQAGDVRQITNPDGTTRHFAYDAEHRMTSQTNERGLTTDYGYDAFGHIAEARLPERPIFDPATGSVNQQRELRRFTPAETQGLINALPSGTGTPDNPAPPVEPPLSGFEDGLGRTTRIATDPFGAPTKLIDPLGRTTLIERDANGLPVRTTQPDGAQTTRLYDSRGNLLVHVHRLIDPRTPATVTPLITQFAYEPQFSQLTTIIDARRDSPFDPNPACIDGCRTTIEHDSRGNPVQIVDQLGNATGLTYEARGLVVTVTDPLGTQTPAIPDDHQVRFAYDPVTGNLLTTTDPLNRTTELAYSPAGQVVQALDAAGQATTFAYDLMNRLQMVTDAATSAAGYAYDPVDNLLGVTDAKGQATAFAYDALNQLTSVTNALGEPKRFFYDAARNLAQVRDANDQTSTFSYDAANQLTSKRLSDPAGVVQDTVTYAYDALGNLALVQDADSQLAFEYDSASRLIKNVVGDAANPAFAQVPETISYAYSRTGQRQSVGCARCASASYTYDGLNRLIGINAPNLISKQFQYDAASRLTRISGGGGAQSAYTYDAASQLLTIRNTLLGTEVAPLDYAYDPAGNRTSLTDRFGAHTYAYDALNRLLSADHPLASQLLDEAFTYDPVGNRVTSHRSAQHVHNAANRLLEDDTFTYAYDAAGNRVTRTAKADGAVTTYRYDVEHQLVGLDLPDGRLVRYRYDGLGRRIEKDVAGQVTRYLYDQEDLVASFTGPTACQTHAVLHGPGIDQPLAFLRDTNGNCEPFVDGAGFREPIVDLFTDGLGSVIALAAETGGFFRTSLLQERVTYDSFGTPRVTGPGPDGQLDTGDDVTLTQSAFGQPYAFTGREYDPEAGLYHYRARAYDPGTGTFLQEDPLGLWAGTNLYTYAHSNPLILTDPFGLLSIVQSPGPVALVTPFNEPTAAAQTHPPVEPAPVVIIDPIQEQSGAEGVITDPVAPPLGGRTCALQKNREIIRRPDGTTEVEGRGSVGADGGRSRIVRMRDKQGNVVGVWHEVRDHQGNVVHRDWKGPKGTPAPQGFREVD